MIRIYKTQEWIIVNIIMVKEELLSELKERLVNTYFVLQFVDSHKSTDPIIQPNASHRTSEVNIWSFICTVNIVFSSRYQLMQKCWTEKPEDRPTFQAVQDELKTFIQSDEGVDEGAESKPLMSNVDIGGSTEYLEVIG